MPKEIEIGTIVKIEIPYKLGERRNGDRYKIGKVIEIYENFLLIEFEIGKYRECYRENEVEVIMK